MVDTIIPGVGYTFFPDWHLATYITSMRKLEALPWHTFIPGHFWAVDRAGFASNLNFYERMSSLGEEALIEGVDADDLEAVTRWTTEHLRNEFGEAFRYSEYAPLNVMRYMLHFRTGGWGLEDNGGLVRTETRPEAVR